MAEEYNFKKGLGLIPAAVCPDCGQRMQRQDHYDFSGEKYRCMNPDCPGKNQKEKRDVRKSHKRFDG